MFKKILMWLRISMIVGIILGPAIYFFFNLWEEGRIAKGVTISVKDSSNSPIPAVIIRLKRTEPFHKQNPVLQLQTDQRGEIYIRRLTPGRYEIMAIQLYCDGGKTEAYIISLNIQGQNTKIQYFPCGNR